jgi:hypothetical protein
MTDIFQTLLEDLGKTLHLSLRTDDKRACSIFFPSGLVIQLQLDDLQTHLFFFSKLTEIFPGKFRENVLCEALKANNLPDPRNGTLAYFPPTNHLVLFQKYPLTILNKETLAGLFGSFLEMAQAWHKAIQDGQPAPLKP